MQYLKFATIKLSIFVLFLTVMAHLHYLHSQSVGHDLHCGKHVYAVGNDETADLGQDILLYFVLNILQVLIDWAFFFFLLLWTSDGSRHFICKLPNWRGKQSC